MKKILTNTVLRCVGIAVCLLLAVSCGGDSHPLHGKTVFDSWERPVQLPHAYETEPITEGFDPTAQDTSSEEETERILSGGCDLWENTDTQEETGCQNNESTSCDNVPNVVLGDAEYLSEEGIYRIAVSVSDCPKDSTFAFLLILHTQGNDPIYAVDVEDICDGLHFSYINKNNAISVMIDGQINESREGSYVTFYINVITDDLNPPVFSLKYFEFAENK